MKQADLLKRIAELEKEVGQLKLALAMKSETHNHYHYAPVPSYQPYPSYAPNWTFVTCGAVGGSTGTYTLSANPGNFQ